ncbi:hypothetical protein H0G86_006087 [Trichoderma simmonsii]|uniref:Uncharacterized protein n=1 Tax=Trichoderma simmonsii TaxID=1491479 RepID=A0A8G0LAT9_9HYPO|nr:hypothetical protein H0G86_006087 [Trichoderma simmonsii]
MNVVGTVIIRSLTKAQALKIIKSIKDYGPLLLLLQQAFNQNQEGKALKQKEQAYERLTKCLQDVQQREIIVIPGAFNSTPTFVEIFQAAALGAIPLVLLSGVKAIERVGASLDGIRSELAISNVSKIQGWGDGGFGAYVHRFVQNEMTVVYGAGDEHRFFYVWHPDTDWHPRFEERQREEPLGASFGGYHNDLATICMRMRADREALSRTTEYGRAAIFHLIIPAYCPLVIDHPIAFSYGLLPLVVTGGRHRGTDLVWFNLARATEQLTLNYIGTLPQKSINPVFKGGIVGTMGCMLSALGGGVASIVFPPFAPVAASALVTATFHGVLFASLTAGVTGEIYEGLTKQTTQVLGNPIFLE